MPIKISMQLPAARLLEAENIFVMNEDRAISQDIRPLRIVILNLMPNKEVTETQLLRMIANTPLQVEVVLLRTASYKSKTTAAEHLSSFYRTFDQIKTDKSKFDGLIITGAPVEQLEFESVAYWEELKTIMEWARKNVYSTFYICWAAQAGLYYNYGIKKHFAGKKIFGVFPHRVCQKNNPVLKGFDDIFFAPHSRHTQIAREDIAANDELLILAESDEAGVYIAASKDLRNIFVTGHGEYDADSLHNEYIRDIGKGMTMDLPKNYYENDDPNNPPRINWRAHTSLLFMNWLNYCVYQQTPYNIDEIGESNV